MIKTVNLSKSVHDKLKNTTHILKNVSVEFPNKGLIFILGKSGSGKTTLLNLLGGLDNFNEGDILINKLSTKNFKQKDFDNYRNGEMGFIFQDFNLLEDMNVAENLMLPLQLQGKKKDILKVSSLLKKLELSGFENRHLNEISGGQKQRIAIGRAIIKDPKIILADEPTGNLDSETSTQILNLLKEISKEKLVIIVTHDRESAFFYGDRVIELKDGQIEKDLICDVSLNKQNLKKTDDLIKNNYNNEKCFVPLNKQYTEKLVSDNVSFAPIKSHLSLKLSLLMGTSFFKEKKMSLIFVVLFTSCLYFIQIFVNLFAFLFLKLSSWFNFLKKIKDEPNNDYSQLYKDFDFEELYNFIHSMNKLFFYVSLIILLCTIIFVGGFVKKSIQFKKKEIGILRSLGARGIDVFKIFFSEGLVLTVLITIVSYTFVCLTKVPSYFFNVVQELITKIEGKMGEMPIQDAQNDPSMKKLIDFTNQIIKSFQYWSNVLTRYDVLFFMQFFVILFSVFISIFIPIYRFSRKKPIDIILNK